MDEWKQALREGVVTGTVACVLSVAVLALAGRREAGSAVAPVNAVSHWLWGEDALHENHATVRHTLLGYLTHHLAAIFWAVLYARCGDTGPGPSRCRRRWPAAPRRRPWPRPSTTGWCRAGCSRGSSSASRPARPSPPSAPSRPGWRWGRCCCASGSEGWPSSPRGGTQRDAPAELSAPPARAGDRLRPPPARAGRGSSRPRPSRSARPAGCGSRSGNRCGRTARTARPGSR